jgi:hypothetical protein
VEYNKFFFISYCHVIKLVLRDILNKKIKIKRKKKGKETKNTVFFIRALAEREEE